MPTQSESNIGLFLDAGSPVEVNKTIDLSIAGSNSGVINLSNTTSLYLDSDETYDENINLYLNGTYNLQSTNNYLNLYVNGPDGIVTNSTNLYLNASQQESGAFNNLLTLYISGDGILQDSTPSGTYLNLLLYGTPGVENNMSMYLQCADFLANDDISLFTFGISGIHSNNINMYLQTGSDSSNNYKHLFIRGKYV